MVLKKMYLLEFIKHFTTLSLPRRRPEPALRGISSFSIEGFYFTPSKLPSGGNSLIAKFNYSPLDKNEIFY
jgi:hypothetical protein